MSCDADEVAIWIGGSFRAMSSVLSLYTLPRTICVSVVDATFVYDGRAEAGMRIGLLAYPADPLTLAELREHAAQLAMELLHALGQRSALICDRETHRYLALRPWSAEEAAA